MDTEKNVASKDAPSDDTQSEQVAETETSDDSPEVPAEKEEKILGKFDSVDDLAKSYKELESKTTQLAQEKAKLEEMTSQVPEPIQDQGYQPTETPQLEPDSAQAVKQMLNEELERKKEVEFQQRHADELKDPLLLGTTMSLIREANMKGQYLDQEVALTNAKKLLEERLKDESKKAQTQGVEEGQELSRKKEQAGPVGDTNKTRPKVNPEDLSAEEFAQYHGLKYKKE